MNQLQQNIESLEYQNQVYRRRLQQLSSLVETSKLAEFLAFQGVRRTKKVKVNVSYFPTSFSCL